ncbi:hypothetical protein D9611_004350 [Ephemerocybe angulata]|uniref:MIT domain-containing protein n=1 Tax=Ephemerocybe angulata TaxID=980116 RepID=A0A8H5F603_9AGAR|nr:hypothetical protein D9611_004350 [Tulosesus angulatus]
MPPPIEMPMNTANQHAASAEEYVSRGLIVLAAEEHSKASEALLAAIERSHDESAKRTLRLLYNKHCKERDDLYRRIEKLKSDGKDPNLPQKSERPSTYSNSRPNSQPAPPSSFQGNPHTPQFTQPQSRLMSDSSNTVDESFMVLGGQRSDPGDAFNQFWSAMQGMLDNLSQPVAFATAPLGPEVIPSENNASGSQTPPLVHGRRDSSLSSDTDNDEHMLSGWARRIGITSSRERTKSKSSAVKPKAVSQAPKSGSSSMEEFGDGDDFLEEVDDLSGSFCLIPSGSEPAALRKENAQLKAEAAAMAERLSATEKLLRLRKDQDMQLRNSIFEAQRAISASGILPRVPPGGDINFLNFNKAAVPVPIPSLNAGREAQYSRRIQELEAELRAVRAENEKNKLMITKFRERWEKLKESAKRKKEAKAVADGSAPGVKDRIVEEPEAEEELDGTGG